MWMRKARSRLRQAKGTYSTRRIYASTAAAMGAGDRRGRGYVTQKERRAGAGR